ncbi:pyridoxamine 5'-phosphate oxidase family protein [Halohasta salina]|uniref:pyridoxamine 5'-phosphate oxidase family protein n=1 Tax=Halohasta salina TaxID=2961621 RepID=UPI0020A4F08E|nr:pyridoxamine 5'-phosphate oxidase family protein [Halohasta salina]
MQGLRWVQLTDEERDEFLRTGGTGVLSFATDRGEPPVSIPVSYGYFADADSIYFRLSVPEDSRKTTLVDNPISFVVHRETEAGWRSIVATGRLEAVDDAPYESAALQGLWAVDIPTVDVFERPPSEIPYETYRLIPDELTGRKEVGTEE